MLPPTSVNYSTTAAQANHLTTAAQAAQANQYSTSLDLRALLANAQGGGGPLSFSGMHSHNMAVRTPGMPLREQGASENARAAATFAMGRGAGVETTAVSQIYAQRAAAAAAAAVYAAAQRSSGATGAIPHGGDLVGAGSMLSATAQPTANGGYVGDGPGPISRTGGIRSAITAHPEFHAVSDTDLPDPIQVPSIASMSMDKLITEDAAPAAVIERGNHGEILKSAKLKVSENGFYSPWVLMLGTRDRNQVIRSYNLSKLHDTPLASA